MTKSMIGWDVGGAHLKAARVDACGVVQQVLQKPCPLWLGIDQLRLAFTEALSELPPGCDRHSVTMTGELVDCFDSREHGVMSIIQVLQDLLPQADLLIFAGADRFLPAASVTAADVMAIASANWLASVLLVARRLDNALFVDMGSTTTDILLIENHRLNPVGYTDYQRLVSGELLYTGVVRSAVMAVAQQAEFNGQWMGLMTEYFATMADVYRLTGDLHEAHDQSATADGAEKTPLASARRLSRMTGYEFDEQDWSLWLDFANHLRFRQKELLLAACRKQLLRSTRPEGLTLLGAGVGRFLLRELASELALPYRDFTDFIPNQLAHSELDVADCAPAVAVAYLAGGFG